MFFADENECEEGRQADKDKARLLMKSLLKEIASKCKGEGVAETRCIAVPAVIERVICSSLMLSLTKIQQSFVLYGICTIYFQVVGSQYLCVLLWGLITVFAFLFILFRYGILAGLIPIFQIYPSSMQATISYNYLVCCVHNHFNIVHSFGEGVCHLSSVSKET